VFQTLYILADAATTAPAPTVIITPIIALEISLLGLMAGLLGGLLGVGGSVIMIPGATFLLKPNQHVYQAAAMIANIAVAIPATMRHHKAGAILKDVVKWMAPVAIVSVFIGVMASNLPIFHGVEGGIWLGRILALFLAWEVGVNILKITRPAGDHPAAQLPVHTHVTPARSSLVGGVMGFIGGLLGIGGGAMAVPLQQSILKLPLKNAIANSSACMVLSALTGAIYKNLTLPQQGHAMTDGLMLAAMLAPTCWIGGHIGAKLTHSLPIRQVRIAFVIVMAVFAWKMAAIPWP